MQGPLREEAVQYHARTSGIFSQGPLQNLGQDPHLSCTMKPLHCKSVIEVHSRELIRSLPREAIRQAQSAEKVARAIVSKFAPRYSESDPARTKCREDCASTCLILTRHCAHHERWTLKKSKNDVLPRSQPLLCQGLQSTAPATKYCTCHTESSPCPKWKMTTVSQSKTCDPFKASSKFTKYTVPATKWPPKPPLILTHACQRFSNV